MRNREDNYVWYVSYGSNMLIDRFLCYIKGGSYNGSRSLPPCNDTSDPVEIKPYIIPRDMYFGYYSSQWDGGVSFLDTTKPGKAYGVAYLITREQYEHVACQENGGYEPEDSSWYNKRYSLGSEDGIEVLTLTNNGVTEYNMPSERYLEVIRDGIRQNYPDIAEDDINRYLSKCIRENE